VAAPFLSALRVPPAQRRMVSIAPTDGAAVACAAAAASSTGLLPVNRMRKKSRSPTSSRGMWTVIAPR
jgi:hypothetical protein